MSEEELRKENRQLKRLVREADALLTGDWDTGVSLWKTRARKAAGNYWERKGGSP